MVEAKRRNPDIRFFGLSWGFPGWVAEGGSHALTNSTVLYVVNWLKGARLHHGLDIDYIGVQNERQYGTGARQYMIDLHKAIQEANLSTLIVGVDDCCPAWGVCPDLAQDPEWLAVVSRVGGHYPSYNTTDECRALAAPKWSSEDSTGGYLDGPHWARIVNRNYVTGQLTATLGWNLITAYDDDLPYAGAGMMKANSPWSGHYAVDQVIWANAHTTQFTRVGSWYYLAHGSGVGELTGGAGTYVALTNGSALTIVVEAMGNSAEGRSRAADQNVTFQLLGNFTAIPSLHVFRSSFARDADMVLFQYEGTVQPVDGLFSFIIKDMELYTFSTVNGSHGDHGSIPDLSDFPLPYADDFERYPLHGYPLYLTDQVGYTQRRTHIVSTLSRRFLSLSLARCPLRLDRSRLCRPPTPLMVRCCVRWRHSRRCTGAVRRSPHSPSSAVTVGLPSKPRLICCWRTLGPPSLQ